MGSVFVTVGGKGVATYGENGIARLTGLVFDSGNITTWVTAGYEEIFVVGSCTMDGISAPIASTTLVTILATGTLTIGDFSGTAVYPTVRAEETGGTLILGDFTLETETAAILGSADALLTLGAGKTLRIEGGTAAEDERLPGIALTPGEGFSAYTNSTDAAQTFRWVDDAWVLEE
jgi:hypothetical protein